jgi:hypothetical protein
MLTRFQLFKATIAVLLCLTFAGTTRAPAQEAEEFTECAGLLSSPPLKTLLTQNNGQDYWRLPSDRQGRALLGMKCSRDQIVDYFLSANWEFKGESRSYSVNGPPSDLYEKDLTLAFCKPRKIPWRLIFYRCEATAGFSMFEGRITHITAGFNL